MTKKYEYKLIVDGIVQRKINSWFKPNIIAEIVKDLDEINTKSEVIFQVKRIVTFGKVTDSQNDAGE